MFVLLPLLYFWCRDPMHYPSRIRGSILCLFLLSVVVPTTEHSSFNTRATAGESDWQESSLESDAGTLGTERSRMREGTRIGSTMGKFYRNGRRWVFEFSQPAESAADNGSESAQTNVQQTSEVVTTTTDRLTNSTTTITASRSTTSSSSSTKDTDSLAVLPPVAMETVRLRVLENLALQRVVAAISEDSNDVHWTVTGTVTEFGNENWLLLTTILRSPSGNLE